MKHGIIFALVGPIILAGCCVRPATLPTTPVTIPPTPYSQAELPINTDLTQTFSSLDRQLSHGEDFTGAWTMNGDEGYRYKWSRSSLQCSLKHNSLNARCKVTYFVDFCYLLFGRWHYIYKHLEGTVDVRSTTSVTWNSDWSISTNTHVYALLPDQILTRLQEFASPIDGYVRNMTATVPLLAHDSWSNSVMPTKIYDHPVTWLTVNPQSAYATPFTSQGNKLGTSVGLIAHPVVDFGGEPVVTNRPLPPLILRPSTKGKIYVNLEASLSYKEANKQLAALKGQKFTSWKRYTLTRENARAYGLDPASIKPVPSLSLPGFLIIKDISISGGGNMALLMIQVSGFPFSGRIYFIGSLKYDQDKFLLTVEHLNFRTADNGFFLVADWVIHGPLLAKLDLAARWNLSQNITDATTSLEAGFKKVLPDYDLTVYELDPKAIYSTEDSFKILVELVGGIAQQKGAQGFMRSMRRGFNPMKN